MVQNLTRLFIYLSLIFLLSNLYLDLFNNKNLINIAPKFYYLGFSIFGMFIIAINQSLNIPRKVFNNFFLPFILFLFYSLLHFIFYEPFTYGYVGSTVGIKFLTDHFGPTLTAFIFFLVIINAKYKFFLKEVLYLIYFIGLFSAIHCFVDIFILESLFTKDDGRGDALYNNSNVAGIMLALSYSLVFETIINKQKALFRILSSLIFAIGIICTFSKTAFLLLAFTIAYYFFRNFFTKNFRVTPTNVISVLGIFLLLSGAVGSFVEDSYIADLIGQNSLSRISTIDVGDESWKDRFDVVIVSLRYFLNNPIFGNGLGFTYNWSDLSFSTHNMFLMYLVEMGIIGLILVVAIYYGLFIVDSASGRIFFYLYFVASFFSHNLFNFLPFWYLFFPYLLTDKSLIKRYNLMKEDF